MLLFCFDCIFVRLLFFSFLGGWVSKTEIIYEFWWRGWLACRLNQWIQCVCAYYMSTGNHETVENTVYRNLTHGYKMHNLSLFPESLDVSFNDDVGVWLLLRVVTISTDLIANFINQSLLSFTWFTNFTLQCTI